MEATQKIGGAVQITGPQAVNPAVAMATSLAAIEAVEGTTADAAITTNAVGTISGKLRGLVAILANVWDSVNSRLNVAVASSALPTGAATAANQVTEISGLSSIDGRLAGTLAVSGPLTDAQMRAAAVPVSGPLTDVQLRAAAVPVSAAALPLPTGASTEATLALIKAKTDNLDVTLSSGGAHVTVDSIALVGDAVPSYVAGQSKPLSMTSDGRLRVITLEESYNFRSWGRRCARASPKRFRAMTAWN